MSTFFGNYLLFFFFFCLKWQKMRYLHCVVKFRLRKLGRALTRYENAVPQLRNYAALQKLKKLNCSFCAALLLVEKIVALCCATLLIQYYLCLPLEVQLRLDLVRKSRYAIAKLCRASTELKSLLRKLRCTSEDKKIKSRMLHRVFTF